jgi:hypothetical protein
MTKQEITDEQWREYDFGGRVYRIEKPTALYQREGGTTHRVVDAAGVVHCVPAPGHCGCVLRWFTGQPDNPVQF